MPLTAAQIWRDFVVAGVPSSGKNKPAKAAIRSWGAWLEAFIPAIGANASVYQTRAELYADLSKPANSMAWVLEEQYSGIYQKVGAAGFGSWQRVADLPYSFTSAVPTGGTANAIQAETTTPVSESSIIVLGIAATNTDSPVSVSFNGGTPITIKDYTGGDIIKGELRTGSVVFGVIMDGVLRLLFDKTYGHLPAKNTGGTANAIQATVDAPVDYANPTTLLSFNVTAPNTVSPVTVSFNGGSALTIKVASGGNVAVGGFQTGMRPLGYIDGSNFRLLSDQASAAIVALAEAAAAAAQGYRDEAANYAALARNDVAVASFTGDGVTTDFALPINPGSKNNITVNVSGATQLKSSYSLVTVGGTPTLRFSEAPPSGQTFEASMGYSVAVGAPGASTVGTSQLIDDAVTLAKIQNIATASLVGRKTAGTGDPEVLSASDVLTLLGIAPVIVDRAYAEYVSSAAISAAIPLDDTIPQVGEGTQILTVSITPKSNTNRLRARVSLTGTTGAANQAWVAAIFSDASANALVARYITIDAANFQRGVELEVEWVPGSTAARTITVRVGPSSGATLYMNGNSAGRLLGGASKCTLVVEEIKA